MNFMYYNPVKIDFGISSLKRLKQWINNRKALLITTEGFKKRGTVNLLLEENPEIIKVIDTIKPNPTVNQLEEIYKLLDFNSFEVIVALGGGSVIDISKALSIYLNDTINNSFEVIKSSLVNGKINENVFYKPIIAIPTTAGTGSEVTPWGTIWDDVNKRKYSIHSNQLWCEVAICDPQLTSTLSKELTIQTGLDALSHSLETIWNTNFNTFSYLYSKTAISEIVDVLPRLVNNLSDLELRSKMMLASLKAGMAFSNTQTSIAHAMSYYMTLYKNIPHGIAVSITLPDIIEVAMTDSKLKPLLQQSLGNNPVQTVQNLLRHIHVETEYSFYDLTKKDFINIEKSLSQTTRFKNSLIDKNNLFYKIYNEIEY